MNRLYSRIRFLVTVVFVTLVACPSSPRAREITHLSGYSEGTIVVKTSQRRLCYVTASTRRLDI